MGVGDPDDMAVPCSMSGSARRAVRTRGSQVYAKVCVCRRTILLGRLKRLCRRLSNVERRKLMQLPRRSPMCEVARPRSNLDRTKPKTKKGAGQNV